MGWEKLRTYIGTDELWELESKKNNNQQYYIIYLPLINRMGKTVKYIGTDELWDIQRKNTIQNRTDVPVKNGIEKQRRKD